MSRRLILTLFLKTLVFTGVLLLISFAIKLSFPYKRQSKWWHHNKVIEDTTFYFIGSSRVQRSISPAILKSTLPNFNFVNLGIGGNSFLYSCQIASQLLQDSSEKKIVFIELSGLSIRPSDAYYFLMSQHDVWNVIRQHLSVECRLSDLSGFLFYMFSIRSDLKKIIYPDLNLYSNPEIGYLPDTKESKASIDGVLNADSFTTQTEISPRLLDAYLDNISKLHKMANRSGSHVIFILPLTIVTASEFNIDMSVFRKLPNHSKWSYSAELMDSMRNSKYLFDDLHLNEAGSVVYSHELSKFIKERF